MDRIPGKIIVRSSRDRMGRILFDGLSNEFLSSGINNNLLFSSSFLPSTCTLPLLPPRRSPSEPVGGDWQKWRENPLRKERGEKGARGRGREEREREKGRGRRRWWTRLMHNSCGCLPCIFSCLNIWIPRSLQYRESGLGKYSAAYSPSLFFLLARLEIPSSTSFDSIRVSGRKS